ncbi:MAG: T9SS type A sorting domain-containing protein [Bacteroidales bacterium]|nr:T9SS type A sorting domain-containing protein [Bacteroidales bacterium]MCB9000088.1 T9SS type A sorting domain-containing protein [Bacteroidales bacterium]MCB9012737.1 T9SS type A sorting domain-containing protein [Bacteroidales bacterium]
MRRIVYLLVFLSGVSMAQKPAVIAHRGGSSLAPENTLAAFSNAVSLNADYFELDVQLSSDDSLMILHDATVDRTTNGTGALAAMSYEQLRLLDAGSWFGPQFAGEKLPTLRESLQVAKSSGNTGVVVEIKSAEETLAPKVVALIQEMGMESRVIVSGFRLSQITQVKALDPGIKVQLFSTITKTNIDQVAAINGEWVGSGGNYTQEVIDYAHSLGIKYNAWTLNTASQMIPVLAMGADGITTDNPPVMFALINVDPPTDVVLSSATAQGSVVNLKWEPAQAPETGISGYEIYRDETPSATTLLVKTENITEYSDQTNNELKTYYYRLKAVNLTGVKSQNYSNELEVTTENDMLPPEVSYISSDGKNSIVYVGFSERINRLSAETKENFSINKGIEVLNSRLAIDQKSVILTTSPMSDDSYSLSVKNIMDQSALSNTIVASSLVFVHKDFSPGIVAFYNLDTLIYSAPDQIVADATANSNNGKLIGGVSLTEGVLGNSLGFDGLDDYVQFNASSSLDINTNAVSVSLWVKLNYLPAELSGPFGPIYDSETDQYVLYEDKSNAELRFKVTTSSGAERPGIPNADLKTGEWIYVTGVYDGSTAKIYLNGVQKDSHPLSGTVKPGQEATLGKSGSTFFSGNMDQVEVYNRALSQEEILAKYEARIPPLASFPLGIEDIQNSDDFSIYPNPSQGEFTIELKNGTSSYLRLEIINSTGKIVISRNINAAGKHLIRLDTFEAGLYIARIFTSSGIRESQLILQ